MEGHPGNQPYVRRGPSGAPALLAATIGLALSTAPLSAQTATAAITTPSQRLCFVFTAGDTAAGIKELRASCGGYGLILGSTTEYQVFTNEALKAVVIDKKLGDERQIVLISVRDDGQPLVEDITGDLALVAGRGVMSDLRGLDINLDGFTADGAINVSPAAGDATSDKSGIVDIGQRIAAERMRRRAPAQN